MKTKLFFKIISPVLAIVILSCNNNKDGEGRDDRNVEKVESKLKINSVYRIKRDGTYVDLNTGKRIMLRQDSLSKAIVNDVTGFPVAFFIDVDTNDTVDQQGRIVNNALLPGENGTWKLDEGKLKKIK